MRTRKSEPLIFSDHISGKASTLLLEKYTTHGHTKDREGKAMQPDSPAATCNVEVVSSMQVNPRAFFGEGHTMS
jgi:hypothetical protein